MVSNERMMRKLNKSFFTKAKRGVKFVEEKYTKYEKSYNFYCPKCRIGFETDTYKYTVTIKSTLNLITKHICGTRCHRFVENNFELIEKLFLESNKTPENVPRYKKMKEKYKKRRFLIKGKINTKDEFEV